jgi:hypothetical protein
MLNVKGWEKVSKQVFYIQNWGSYDKIQKKLTREK